MATWSDVFSPDGIWASNSTSQIHYESTSLTLPFPRRVEISLIPLGDAAEDPLADIEMSYRLDQTGPWLPYQPLIVETATTFEGCVVVTNTEKPLCNFFVRLLVPVSGDSQNAWLTDDPATVCFTDDAGKFLKKG